MYLFKLHILVTFIFMSLTLITFTSSAPIRATNNQKLIDIYHDEEGKFS